MIVNLLRYRFKDEVSEEEKAEALAAMRRTASVESVSYGAVGQDIGDPSEGFTHSLLVGVEDLEALRRYIYDPVHLAGDPVILPRLQRMWATRFSDDPDPGLGAKVVRLHEEKLRRYPEWEALLDAIPETRLSTEV
ncbi:Dabb family protein [Streptomyces sp. NA04227]|uniref:Dabb family protein n=1 Tax=Streptomyces sp. NA04227 TaxID=2742136 RepID=UPI00159057BD|nr:Dabb family protein [Streptomyces sp. NA04227]QKW09375.1 Dabb family protein [Streptomyces sp. NA04227]